MLTNAPLSTGLSSDSRTHGYGGPTRNVRLHRATTNGGGSIDTSPDGVRCVVAGKESLRVLRFYDPFQSTALEHKPSIGRGGHRIDASRNFWDGSGLKIDSASTDVAWGRGGFNTKVLTSARNGELIMWDLNKAGPNKYERRSKDHIRSINKLSVSHVVEHYCITGSSDGDVRVWDLRDISKSLMRIHHPTSIREVIFSPSLWQPLQALVGLDNGSIYRWDLKMGQRGQLDRLPVAHSGPVMALDWCNIPTGGNTSTISGDGNAGGLGWIVSGGLDRCVKVWNLTAAGSYPHIPHKPDYILHPSFPVRRVLWRPDYDCELAIVSNEEFGTGSNHELAPISGPLQRSGVLLTEERGSTVTGGVLGERDKHTTESKNSVSDACEIWDVRRGWIAKWSVTGSAVDGGVTDIAFADSHTIWAQHTSGMFSQIDLRDCTKPIDAISRVAVSWDASGSLAFVSDKIISSEIPYDDAPTTSTLVSDERKIRCKAIGDLPSLPASQAMGTYVVDCTSRDLVAFSKLAEEYVFTGRSRPEICALNADAALRIGKYHAAQAWLLLGSLLTELIPECPNPPIPPASAPATPLSHVFPPDKGSILFKQSSSELFSRVPASPSRLSPRSSEPPSSSTSRKMTPNSSNSPSPRFSTTTLPLTTPRQPSLQRETESSLTGSRRRQSNLRRLSISARSVSPSTSHRHVGEGALEDSDSSSSGKSDTANRGGGSSGEEGVVRAPVISPTANPIRGIPAHPSPLSHVASKQAWTEDDGNGGEDREDDRSPSPRSTDSESISSSSPPLRMKSPRRSSRRVRARRRMSTTASLVVAALQRPLVKQESHSSIRTVTAGDLSFQEEIPSKELALSASMRKHTRQKSRAMSELVLDSRDFGGEDQPNPPPSQFTDRRQDIVAAEEKRYREIGWDALRKVLESFATEGDIQICAFLSLVAPRELQLKQKRVLRFLDAYIDILMRLRLHVSAAYLRKYAQVDTLGAVTQLETTIYLSCGKCRKPFPYPTGAPRPGSTKGSYAFCQTCHVYSVKCSICRRPVRTLLFQCSVCSHGGHRQCYEQFYTQQPMEEIPSTFMSLELSHTPGKGSPLGGSGSDIDSVAVTSSESETSPINVSWTKKLMGHRCAAGCGHFCWVVNETRNL